MCWHKKYREKFWIEWFQTDFKQKFTYSFEDPEDACADAIERLLLVKLPNAQLIHHDNLDGFVMTAFRHIVKDLIRKQDGRIRAPALLIAQGEPYLQIFYEFCLRNNPIDVIAEKLSLPVLSVKDWVKWLVAEDKCPSRPLKVSLTGNDPDNPMQEMELPADDRNDSVAQGVEDERYAAIINWTIDNSATNDDSANDLGKVMQKKLSALPKPTLTDNDRLLLRLLFWEGQSLTTAARLLKVEPYFVRNRRNAILKKIRQYFRDQDINF